MEYIDIIKILFIVWVIYYLIKKDGLLNGLLLFGIIFVIGVITSLVADGYFVGDMGRYFFLIILVPIAIIVNVKKYREYFILKIKQVLQ